MKKFLIKNWKTSFAGIATATAVYLKAKNIIDADAFTYVLGVFVSLGLIGAKDGDKTGV